MRLTPRTIVLDAEEVKTAIIDYVERHGYQRVNEGKLIDCHVTVPPTVAPASLLGAPPNLSNMGLPGYHLLRAEVQVK